MLITGDKATNLALFDQNEKKVSLKDFAKKKVLIYFYPKADTPDCTMQSKQLNFEKKYGLGFTLLSDPEHKVAKAYKISPKDTPKNLLKALEK